MAAARKIHMSEVARNVTLRIRVTGVQQWRFRLWLGAWIMRLAARVIGCNAEIEARP